jgi:tripartite-type tricarboxylate transporter receptor subunit TctC
MLAILRHAALGLAIAAAPALAQDYPTRPIRMIVPQGPGSGADVVSRMMAEKMSAELKQSVVIDNKPGANGIIASNAVIKEPPDGYTVLLTSVSLVSFNQHLYSNVPYKMSDFTFIAPVAEASFVIIASKASGIANWADFLQKAKAKPEGLTYASGGIGNSTHLYMEMVAQRSGVKLRHVPYKGSGPAVTSIVAGETDVMLSTSAGAMGQITGGRVTAIAVPGDVKVPQLPTVPLLKEVSPDVPPLPGWYALVGPANMDPKVVQKLAGAVDKFLSDPAIKAKLTEQFLFPIPGTPESIRKRGETESTLWGGFIRQLNIPPQ